MELHRILPIANYVSEGDNFIMYVFVFMMAKETANSDKIYGPIIHYLIFVSVGSRSAMRKKGNDTPDG